MRKSALFGAGFVDYSQPCFFLLLELKRADNRGQAEAYQNRLEEYDRVEELARSLLAKEGCFSLKSLALGGLDLMELGYEGPAIGEALQCLLEAVLDERVKNERLALLALLEERKRGRLHDEDAR